MPLGLAALDDLYAAFEGLRDSLAGTDAVAIETAAQRVETAAAAVRAIGAWKSDEEVKARLAALVPLLDSARVRINVLNDHASQRLSILASSGSTQAPLTYGR